MSTVARPERIRLLEAMLEELAEKGYPALDVDAAIQRAHLEGGEWSELFPDKDTCLLAALEELSDQMRAVIADGCRDGAGPTERISGGIRALLGELARRAAMAEALVRSFSAIGPAAVAHHQAFVEGLAALLTPARNLAEGVDLPAEVELLAIGAAEALVMDRIRVGQTKTLPDLGPEIIFSVLVPFTGPAAATEAMAAERSRIGADC
jgi:AcrR family transcriptional regulator